MQPLPFLPETPDQFLSLMEQIWDSPCEPLPDGGILCHVSQWYDDWHNAWSVVHQLGLKRAAPTCRNEEKGYIVRFPDGSGLFINRAGSSVDLAKMRRAPRGVLQ